MARRGFRRRVMARAMKRGLLWIQDSALIEPDQLSANVTQSSRSTLLLSAAALSPLQGAGLFTESEGWTVTRIVGFLQITSINNLGTGVSAGWRWTFGIYQGSASLPEVPDSIENSGGSEVDWMHTTGAHMAAHSAADFTPEWMQKELLTRDLDVRVQRKVRGGGGNILTTPAQDVGSIFSYFSVTSENLDNSPAENLDVSARLTWRMLLRKPGR